MCYRGGVTQKPNLLVGRASPVGGRESLNWHSVGLTVSCPSAMVAVREWTRAQGRGVAGPDLIVGVAPDLCPPL